jgi:hypothetical protein
MRDINTGTWPSRLGESQKLGQENMGPESHGTQTLEGLRWQGQAATVNYRPVLSSERAPQNNKPPLSKENFKEKENWSRALIVA